MTYETTRVVVLIVNLAILAYLVVALFPLYWLFITLSLVIPDFVVNGRALSLWRRAR